MIRASRLSARRCLRAVLWVWVAGLLHGGAGPARALELRAGDIVVSDPSLGAILRIDPQSGVYEVISSGDLLRSPNGLVLDGERALIVADPGANLTGAILRVDLATGDQTILATGLWIDDPDKVVFGPSGDLFVTNRSRGVVRVDPDTGDRSFVFDDPRFGNTVALALDAGERLIVGFLASQPTNLESEVYALDPSTGERTVISSGGSLAAPVDIAFDEAERILVADTINNLVIRIDPVTGIQEVVASDFPGFFRFGLRALDFEADGSLLVASSRREGEGLYRVELDGSPPTLLTALKRPLGMLVVPGLRIRIDIKPNDDRNTIQVSSRGVVPVAVLGSDEFAVTDIDSQTLVFGPERAIRAHSEGPHLADLNEDGFTDLLAHFRIQATGIAHGDTEACLSGELLDGTQVEGCDPIETFAGCGRGFETAVILPLVVWGGTRGRRRLIG